MNWKEYIFPTLHAKHFKDILQIRLVPNLDKSSPRKCKVLRCESPAIQRTERRERGEEEEEKGGGRRRRKRGHGKEVRCRRVWPLAAHLHLGVAPGDLQQAAQAHSHQHICSLAQEICWNHPITPTTQPLAFPMIHTPHQLPTLPETSARSSASRRASVQWAFALKP